MPMARLRIVTDTDSDPVFGPSADSTKRKKILDAIHRALPATTVKEIARKVSRDLGETVKSGLVGVLLSYLRAHCIQEGWMCIHVKKGKPGTGDTNRFFAILVDSSGDPYFDEEHRRHFEAGSQSMLRTIRTFAENHAMELKIIVAYERSTTRRSELRDMHDDLAYVAKRCGRILKAQEDAGWNKTSADGTDGS